VSVCHGCVSRGFLVLPAYFISFSGQTLLLNTTDTACLEEEVPSKGVATLRAAVGDGLTKLFMLWQMICDVEPLRLGAHEDVSSRPDCRAVSERSKRDVNESTLANDGVEE
jgi:hypothetical protein